MATNTPTTPHNAGADPDTLFYTVSTDQDEFSAEQLGALGARVFTTMIVHPGTDSSDEARLFHFDWHLERLSRNLFALDATQDQQSLKKKIENTAVSALRDAASIAAGDVIKFMADHTRLSCLVAPYKSSWKHEFGITLAAVQHERSYPMLKSINSLASVLAQKEARQLGADEALLIDRDGFVREGAWCNIFWIRNGTLYSIKDAVLPGITRRDLLTFERCELVNCKLDELLNSSEEIFVTQSTTGITPVRSVLDHKNYSAPGPITKELQARYRERVLRESISISEII